MHKYAIRYVSMTMMHSVQAVQNGNYFKDYYW